MKHKGYTDPQRLSIWKQLDAGVSAWSIPYEVIVKRVFEAQRTETLQKLPMIMNKAYALKVSKQDVEPILLDINAQQDRFNEALNGVTIDIMIGTAKNTADIFDFVVNYIEQPDMQKFAERSINKFAKSSTDTNNQKVAESMIEGMRNGDTVQEMRDRINAVYDQITKQNAMMIARTETTRITTWTNEQIYRSAGIEEKEWLVNPGACEFCVPYDGKIVPMTGKFASRGDSTTGADGGELSLNYETVKRPPLHVNCRCDLLPVI